MMFDYTEQEQKEIDLLEAEYEKLIKAAEDRIEYLAVKYHYPETTVLFKDIDPRENPEEWEKARKEETSILDEWFNAAPAEWKEAVKAHTDLIFELNDKRRDLFAKCERRSFREIGSDKQAILNHAKEQVKILLDAKEAFLKDQMQQGLVWDYGSVFIPGDPQPKLLRDITENTTRKSLHLHYDALKRDKNLTDQLNQYIEEVFSSNPRIIKEDPKFPEGKPLIRIDMNLHNEDKKARAKKQPTMEKQISILEGMKINGFALINQSQPYNQLIYRLGRKPDDINKLGDRKIRAPGKNSLIITASGLPEVLERIPTSAARLLDIFNAKATESGMKDNTVAIPLNEYMNLRGIKDMKEARKQVRADMDILQQITVEFRDSKSYVKINLGGGIRGIKNSIVFFTFNEHWLKIFPFKNQLMPYPLGILSTSDKYNPHSFYFGRKIAEMKRVNAGSKNEGIIGVSSLVECSPTFPKYEDLGDHKRVSQLIIEPFERDLDEAAKQCGCKWHYIGLESETGPTTYEQFIKAKIRITWDNYPDNSTIIKGREEYKKLASKIKEKAASGG